MFPNHISNDLYCQADSDKDLLRAREDNNEYRNCRWFLDRWDLPNSTECIEHLNSPEITRLNKLAIIEYELGGL